MINITKYVNHFRQNPDELYQQVIQSDYTYLTSELRRIQLDSFKEGIRYAAERVRRQPLYSDFSLSHVNGEQMMCDKLMSSAGRLVEVPNDVAEGDSSLPLPKSSLRTFWQCNSTIIIAALSVLGVMLAMALGLYIIGI